MHTVFVIAGRHSPPGCFLGVVAAFAVTQAVRGTGRPVAVMRLGVVAMPDRSITVGRATGLIPQPDEAGQAPREEPRPQLFQLHTNESVADHQVIGVPGTR